MAWFMFCWQQTGNSVERKANFVAGEIELAHTIGGTGTLCLLTYPQSICLDILFSQFYTLTNPAVV